MKEMSKPFTASIISLIVVLSVYGLCKQISTSIAQLAAFAAAVAVIVYAIYDNKNK